MFDYHPAALIGIEIRKTGLRCQTHASLYGPQEPVAQFFGNVFMFASPVGRNEDWGLGAEDDTLPPLETYFPRGTGARGLIKVFTKSANVFATPQNKSVIMENRNHDRLSCTEPSEFT